MSKYGRMWQEASDMRTAIQQAFACPLPHNYKPADVRTRIESLERLVKQWEALEEEMRQTND